MFIRNRHRRATGGVLRAASSFPTRLFSAPSKKKVFGARTIPLQVCDRGGEWATPGKLGRQVQEESESGPLFRSPCTADQLGEPLVMSQTKKAFMAERANRSGTLADAGR